jgi:hypothetical protein
MKNRVSIFAGPLFPMFSLNSWNPFHIAIAKALLLSQKAILTSFLHHFFDGQRNDAKKSRPLPGPDYIGVPLLENFLRSASQTHPDSSGLKHAPPTGPQKIFNLRLNQNGSKIR